ncbi:unnamed protein product [Bursaphelenchus xylophilus]|uniref:(pine wood nematode) hypothetical protein n=1 Tax=Bursaphelenchus xylophilus TaxID=6326 RepID=A0A1I7SMC5_BURXY|nr:unnamed protein product [Bursaphelenchus xylophilus]CAG9130111.1 unnamed protein product [Bursaphelenchus xylophilus]
MARQCIKCQKPGEYTSLETTKAVFCYECYLESIKQKFRAALSKTKLFKQSEPIDVLVVAQKDVRSEALIKLMKESYDERKKLKLNARIFYVNFSGESDDCSIDETDEDKPDTVDISLAFCRNLNSVHLMTGSFQIPKFDYFYVRRLLPDNAALKDEFKRLLMDYFVYRLAERLGISTVLTAENAETLAQKTLNATCMGRADSIPHVTNVLDQRHPSVNIVRPLRNITNTEIAFLTSKAPSTTYGNSVSSKFLENVTANGYPGTVSTVLSVASKIQAVVDEEIGKSSSPLRCWLCQMPSKGGLCQGCTNFTSQIPFRQRQDFLEAFDRGEVVDD